MSEEKEGKKSKIELFKANAENDPDFKGFTKAKKHILHALKINKGNVTATAVMLGIARGTIYKNCNTDTKFMAAFEDIKEMKLDFVENKLMQRIDEGSDALIMYVLSCQGAERGWVSSKKLDVTSKGESLNKGFYDFLKEVSVTKDGSGS
jgi:hypothetical protein